MTVMGVMRMSVYPSAHAKGESGSISRQPAGHKYLRWLSMQCDTVGRGVELGGFVPSHTAVERMHNSDLRPWCGPWTGRRRHKLYGLQLELRVKVHSRTEGAGYVPRIRAWYKRWESDLVLGRFGKA